MRSQAAWAERRQGRLLAAGVLLALTACGSNPAVRRARVIADADRDAKAAVAKEGELDVAKIPAKSFAVIPFSATTHDTLIDPLRYGLASMLVNDLAKSPQLKLVERLHTEAILRELKMVDDGITDPKDAPRAGRLMGARRMLIGDAASGSDRRVRLSARVVDVLSGTVEDLLTADAPVERVLDAEKALALLIFDKLGITLTPAQRTRVEQQQTKQLAALVAYGRGAQADAKGDAAVAAKSYQQAVQLDGRFSVARAQAATITVAATAPTATNLERVLDFSAQAINVPVVTKTADLAAAPLAASNGFTITFVIRVIP